MKQLNLSIITQNKTCSCSIKYDVRNPSLMLCFISIFADYIDWNNGKIIGKSFQQASSSLLTSIKELISNLNDNAQLWSLYDLFKSLQIGEYFYVTTNNIKPDDISSIQQKLFEFNTPDYTELVQFKETWCKELVERYRIIHYSNKDKVSIGETDKSQRTCRFCGRKQPDVSFNNIAHTISEGLGNKNIITNDECDECNKWFGKEIEQDLIIYLSIFRVFFSIKGKKGLPKVKDNSFRIASSDENILSIDLYEQSDVLDKHWEICETDGIKISLSHPQQVNFQDIYRAIVKYALGVIEQSELSKFSETLLWLRKRTSASEFPPILVYQDNNPISAENPQITVFLRRDNDKATPYSFVELRMAGVIVVSIIPFCSEDTLTFSMKDDYLRFQSLTKIYSSLSVLKV